ncbi:MAG: hypothetical protein L0Y64_21340 [Myxococcaceae bacterium]|nr:hypothetical protein [Myxococcaceae bacterium]
MRTLGLLFLLASGAALAQGRGHPTEAMERGAPQAQDASRPDEDDVFGGEEAPAKETPARADEEDVFGGGEAPTKEAVPASTSAAAADRDAADLEGPATVSAFDRGDEVDDPLRIGGQLYFRSQASWSKGQKGRDVPITLPTLVDAYLDAKPSDRIRGFVSGRLVFDASQALGSAQDTADAGSGTDTTGMGLFGQARGNPSVVLDQAWLRFDVDRKLFLTVGKQHVRWGVSRFFVPTDFLSPQARDPLAVFDARLGASMAKVHIPVESLGWNFYAIGLLDNAGPANALGKLGGALRAEMLLGPAEVSLGAVFVKDRKARYGLSVSSPLGPVDVYGEVAVREGTDAPVYQPVPGFSIEGLREDLLEVPLTFSRTIQEVDTSRWNANASGGLTYTLAYADNESITFGAEYAFNQFGVDDFRLYPILQAVGIQTKQVLFQPFNVGRHYGAVYAMLMDPGPLQRTTFTVSSLANLSDRSAVARLDVIYRALQYLQVEGFASVNYGRAGGEFRYGGDLVLPIRNAQNEVVQTPVYPPVPQASFGLGLRVSI